MESFQPLRLAVGHHQAGSGKGCAMNVESWINGDKKITDLPSCADPLLARFVQVVNDSHCEHRKGDLLCAPCSVEVLELAARTRGTNLVDHGWSLEHVYQLWIRLAEDEVFSDGSSTPYSAALHVGAAKDWAASGNSDAIRNSAGVAIYAAWSFSGGITLERVHGFIDRFEEITGVRATTASPEVVQEAIENMLTSVGADE